MQKTSKRNTLITLVALVLVGIFAAVAAVCLPGSAQNSPSMDNTVADSDSAAEGLSSVSVSETAPAKDGTVENKQTIVPDGWTKVDSTTDWSALSNSSGNYILMENITITDFTTSGTFSGTLDGNGYEIEINIPKKTGQKDTCVGGMFSVLSGTVKNAVIKVTSFSYGVSSVAPQVGMIAGNINGGSVDNVKLILNYNPSTPCNGDNTSDFYVFDSSSRSMGSDSSTIIGGIAGTSDGAVNISNFTLENNATTYGFGISAWRDSNGDFSQKTYYCITGGFIGKTVSGTATFTNIKVAGTGSIINHAEKGGYAYEFPSGKYRNFAGYNGAVIGEIGSDSTVNIYGMIYSMTGNITNTEMVTGISNTSNYNGGRVTGKYNGTSCAINGVYWQDNITTQWFHGDSGLGGENSNTGVVLYDADAGYDPEFGGEGIIFNGFNKKQISSSELVFSIANGDQGNVFVYDQLAVADSASEGAVCLSFAVATNSAVIGNDNADFGITYANQGTFALAGANVFDSVNEAEYHSTQVYNNEVIPSRGIAFYGKDSEKVDTVENVYAEQNANPNAGEHVLVYNASALTDNGYKSLIFGERTYYINESSAYVYSVSNVIVGEEEIAFIPTLNQKVLITPADLQLAFSKTEDIVYRDNSEILKGKFTVSVASGKLYGNIDSWDIASAMVGDVVYDETTAAGNVVTVTVNTESVVLSDGNGNYNITWQNTSADSTVQKLVLNGTFSGLDNLVYNAKSQKTAIFTVEGLEDEIVYSYVKDGEESDVVNAGTYTVTASVENESIVLNGNSIDFTVSPYTVTITEKEGRPLSHVYNSGVVSPDDLFNIPVGVENEELVLAISATKDGQPASVELVGNYEITANLAEGQENYVAQPVTVSYAVTPYILEISISEAEKSKVYDGNALTEEQLKALFTAPVRVEGAELPLAVTVEGEKSVLDADTYNITATVPAENIDATRYALKEDVTVEFTVEKAPVRITANKDASTSKDFDGKVFDDFASLFNDIEGVKGEEVAVTASVEDGKTILNAGTYTVIPALDANVNNYFAESVESVVYTVNSKTVEIIWSVNDYTYNGSVQTVKAEYTDIDGAEVELSVSFGEGVAFKNAGEYTATASFAESDNAFGNYVLPENVTNTYNIKKADSVINTDGVETVYTYTGGEQAVNSGATLNHNEATLEYGNNTFTTVAEGNGLEVVISVAESENYNGATAKVVITVNKATPSVSASVEIPESGLFTSSEMPDITANTIVAGSIAWDEGQTLTFGENFYTWTFVPDDTDNYNVANGSEKLSVKAVALDRIEVIALPSKVEYQYGDKFDKTGMVIEAVNNDGSRFVVEDYTSENDYLTTLGSNDVIISYNDKTATVKVTVEAKEFEIAYSDLTVVTGTEDFDVASITASIVGTDGSTVNIAGNDYTYKVELTYTDSQYNADAEAGTEYPLTVTVTVTGIDAQCYVGEYTATLRVIATSMEGSWVNDSVIAEYDGVSHAAEFTVTKGGEYEIQYAVKGTDLWSTDVPVNAGEYVAKVVSKDSGYSADRIPTATVTISKKEVSVNWTGDASVVYSGEVYEPSFEATGLVGEDKISVTYSANDGFALTEGKARNAGSYTATGVLPSENYAIISGETFGFAIEKVRMSVEVKDLNKDIEYGSNYVWTVSDFYGNVTFENSDVFTANVEFTKTDDLSGLAIANKGTKYSAYVQIVPEKDGAPVANEDLVNFEFLNEEEASVEVTITVIAKNIEVVATDGNVIYDGEKVGVEELLAIFEFGGVEANVTVNDSPYEEADIKNVGVYILKITSAEENYVFTGTTSATITVNAANVNDVSVIGYKGEYDKTAHSVVVSATATTVDGSEVTFTYATSEDSVYGIAPEYTDAGVYTLYYKASAANHNEASGSFIVTITKAGNEWVVTPSIEDWTYGKTASVPAGEAKFGIATFAYATASGEPLEEMPTNAGSYKLVVTVAETENYEGLAATVDFTIEKANYDMSGVMFGDKTVTYNGKVQSITVSGALPDGVTVTYEGNGQSEAGVYTVTATFATESENYNVPAPMKATLTVDPKELTFTGYKAVGREYTGDKTITLIGGSLSGVISGDEVTFSYRGEMNTANAGVNTVTVYIELTGEDSGNYTVAQPAATTVTITPAPLTVVWGEPEFDYNGNVQAPTATVTGTVHGDSVTLNVTGGAVNAGTHKATAVMATENANYTLKNATIEFTINKLDVKKPVVESAFSYDGTEKTSVVGNEYYTVINGVAKNAGNYTATIALKDTDNTVWKDGTADAFTADWSIAKATLTVENVQAQNKVYDGSVNVTVTGTLSGVIGDDDVTLVIGGVMDDKNVGEKKTVSVSASISGASAGNYTLTNVNDTTVTVSAKELTIVWGELAFEFDGEAKLPTATVETGIDGEEITLDVSVDGEAIQPGKYNATAVISPANGNYSLKNEIVEFTIAKQEVIAQFAVSYGELTITVDGGNNGVEYKIGSGAWTGLPVDGKVKVELAASWEISLRYAGQSAAVTHVIYTSADNVVIYLDNNLRENAIENKEVIDTAKSWLATANGDKTEAETRITAAQEAYEAAYNALEESVENAFKATANLTGRAVATAIALATVSGIGIAVGAVALVRKGGKKNENK